MLELDYLQTEEFSIYSKFCQLKNEKDNKTSMNLIHSFISLSFL